MFFSGTSGIVLPVPNKAAYPQEFRDKSRLNYYSSLFNSIEINSSFYKVPLATTVAKWALEVPEDFRFTFKLWKEISHSKNLVFNEADVTGFLNTINAAGGKTGCLLIQFPKSLTVDAYTQFERLLKTIDHADSAGIWQVAVEFRNDSWQIAEVYELLNDCKATMVLHDMPGTATPEVNSNTNAVYLRLHGPDGRYRGSYSDGFLNECSTRINSWFCNGKTVYCYFNNTIGEAINNLVALNKKVHSAGELT